MKVGLLTALFNDMPLTDVLDFAAGSGIEMVELGTGNYPGAVHCNPDELLPSKTKRDEFSSALSQRGIAVSGLSCHGNPIHPDPDFARSNDEAYRKTVLLAEKLGVPVVNLFSGCPGGGPEDRRPNWVTCTWPNDYKDILAWQWEEVVLPYWRDAGQFASDHGVKLAFEMHPGFVVYNTATLLRLRREIGPVIGANFDPSHLFWQAIEPVAAIRALRGAIYHVHAKDTAIDRQNTAINGVLDTTPYSNIAERSWVFRTVGYGHGVLEWKGIVSALRTGGYDYVLSIEHEDGLASKKEGLLKAVACLRECVLTEAAPQSWWE